MGEASGGRGTDDALARGARLFDAGAYFEAHEAWEERWLVETDAGARRFLQGLIQVAAALHKLVVVRSPASASRLLARGLAKLDACPREVEGCRVGAFVEGLRSIERELTTTGQADTTKLPRMGDGPRSARR